MLYCKVILNNAMQLMYTVIVMSRDHRYSQSIEHRTPARWRIFYGRQCSLGWGGNRMLAGKL